MAVRPNFGSPPSEDPHRDFRNILIAFRKTIQSSKESELLQQEMQRFLNASKEMDWRHKNSGVYKKAEGERAANKVWTEFDRYISDLQAHPTQANPQDLLDALAIVEQLVKSFKVT